jgi:hypothetical protein
MTLFAEDRSEDYIGNYKTAIFFYKRDLGQTNDQIANQ